MQSHGTEDLLQLLSASDARVAQILPKELSDAKTFLNNKKHK